MKRHLAQVESSGDCEAADGGIFDQDANAWSSAIYVVIGVLVLELVRRRRLRPAVAVLAVATIAEGVGSIAFHGAPGDGAQLVHDLALVAMLAYLAGWHLVRARGAASADRAAVVAAVAAAVVGAAVHGVLSEIATVGSGVLVGVILLAEVLARRQGLPAVWSAGPLALAAVAGVTWILGRTDSPVCDPSALTQPHALWHVLSALLVLVWIDRTAGATPDGRAGILRDGVDLALGRAAQAMVFAFHRRVEVIGRDRLPASGPTLIVANHGNGFVDPIVVAAVLGRLPRFIAKAALWRVAPARPFLALAGVVPVYRRQDGDDVSSNRSSFAAVHDSLAGGGVVAIFPEGTTGDRAALDRVRTGAARMALGAVADAPELLVVPVGLAFESRVETRSAVAVVVGEPIPVQRWIDDELGRSVVDDDDRSAVRALTESIRSSLAAVSPEFGSVDERDLLRAVAEVTARRRRPRRLRPPFAEIEVLARALAAAPSAARAEVVEHYRRYATRLTLVGLDDADLEEGASRGIRPLVLAGLAVAVAGSLLLTVTLVHLPALLAVVAITGWVRSTATKGTVRLLVGAAAGLATWVVVGILVADGWAAVAVGVGLAIAGAVALVVWSTVLAAVGRIRGGLRARARHQLADRARRDRAVLVELVERTVLVGSGVPDVPVGSEE
ncbi:MAG: 1-acyl-sn-glycerol-3-phosphate acyltransferase [Actinomycetota bacterium]